MRDTKIQWHPGSAAAMGLELAENRDDHLNIDTFYKAAAYACLYKTCGAKVDAIKTEDITVSLVRDVKPSGLLQYLKRHGCVITNPYRESIILRGKCFSPHR